MNKIVLAILFMIPLSIGAKDELISNSNEVQKVKEIIAGSENIFKEYYMTSDLESRNEKGKIEKTSLIGAIKINSSLSLFIQTSPPVNKGKVFLQRGNENYIYFPKAKRYMLISSTSKLIGNVSYADISKWPTLDNYDIEKAYRHSGNGQTIIESHFTLKENAKDLPYYKKVIYINTDQSRVERIDNYSRSGLLLASCEYSDFKKFNDIEYGMKSKITDRNKPNIYSIMSITDIKETELDQKIFNPGFLQYAENYIMREYKR